MIRAATTLIAPLLTAEIGSEAVEVRDRGTVNLATFECRDTPRSTLIQRACHDRTQAILIVNFKGTYRQYCAVPTTMFEGLMTAPSMGRFYKANIEGNGSDGPYDCRTGRVPGW
jgi:KTSC domain